MFGKFNASYSNYKAGHRKYRPTKDDHKYGFGLCPWDIRFCNDKDSLSDEMLPKTTGIFGLGKSHLLYFPKTQLLIYKSTALTDTFNTLDEHGSWSTICNPRYEQRELEQRYYEALTMHQAKTNVENHTNINVPSTDSLEDWEETCNEWIDV